MGGNAGMTAPLRACRDEGTLPGYVGGIVAALAAVGGLASRCLAEANPRAVGGQGGSRSLRHFGLGHGVGLEIHEAPMMHHDRTGTLGDRVPITVEPGVYLPGQGGVRIEDTLVVRAGAGPGELLTTITKELLVL